MASWIQRSLLAVAASALAGCTSWSEQQNVLVTSDPLGARILVDGLDTGHTTPKSLAIGGNFGADHVIRLEKTGYRPATRRTAARPGRPDSTELRVTCLLC